MEPANAGEGTNVPLEAVRQEANASNEPSQPRTRLSRHYAKALNLGISHFERSSYGAKFNEDPTSYKIVTVDSLDAGAFRGCGAHFIDASCLTLQECPGATGKARHVKEALKTHSKALTGLEVQARSAIARGSFLAIHCKRALCQSVFLADFLGHKLGYQVRHLALKPKVLSLGGSWPLDDGYFTCEDERWIPETISMVAGPSTPGEKYHFEPLEPKVTLPLGFILQTGHLTYGPYVDESLA